MKVKILYYLLWFVFLPAITWSQDLPKVFGEERADVIKARLSYEAAGAFQRFPPPVSREQWEVRKEDLRDWIIGKSGLQFYPNLDLDVHETGAFQIEGGNVKNIYFQTRPGVYATANLYVPDGEGPFPAVITMMGHSSNGKLYDMYRAVGYDLVRNGYVSLHIDPWGAGERTTVHGEFKYHGAHLGASLLNVGETLLGMQLTDNIRGVDLLTSLPYVDASRIGATGASGGGNQTMWLTALDERIKAGMPVVSVGTFESYIMSSNCICETLPDGLTFMEESEVLGLVAPRALRICNAEQESNKAFFPEEMKRSVANARTIYGFYGSEDHLDFQVGETTHGYHPIYREYLIGWLDKHLKGKGDGLKRETIEFVLPEEEKMMVFDSGSRPDAVMSTIAFVSNKREEMEEGTVEAEESKRRSLRQILKMPVSKDILTTHEFESIGGWQRFALETADGYFIPILIRPPGSRSGDYTLLAPTAGKESIDHGLLESITDQGKGVCVVDFWGIGEANSTTAVRLTGTRLPPFHTLSRSLLWLGKTLQGVWVQEIALIVHWLKETHGASQVNFVGDKDLALAGLMYAALNPGKLTALELTDVPASYAFDEEITQGFYSMAVHVPGILKWGDVATMAALAGDPIRISRPRYLDGSLMQTTEEFESKYKRLVNRWGKEGSLIIVKE